MCSSFGQASLVTFLTFFVFQRFKFIFNLKNRIKLFVYFVRITNGNQIGNIFINILGKKGGWKDDIFCWYKFCININITTRINNNG